MSDKNTLFLISKVDNIPFDTLIKYLGNTKILEVNPMKMNNRNDYFISTYWHKGKKKILLKDKFFFLKPISYIYYSFKSIILVKRNINFKYVKVVIVDNLNNFLISYIFKKIFLLKYKIIFSDGDALPSSPEKMYIDENNLISNFYNKLILKLLYILKFYALKISNLTIHSSRRVIRWNKKFIIKDYNYIYFNPTYDFDRCKLFSNRKFNYNFLYIGSLAKSNGFDELIELAAELKSINKIVIFHVIGGEEKHINYYKKKIIKMNLKSSFNFYGFVEYGNKLFEILKKTSLAFAPYTDKSKSVPLNGKIADYINYCLPVITTDYILISSEIKKYRLGLISRNKFEVIKFIMKMEKKSNYENILNNILEFTSANDYKYIYQDLFKKISKKLIN